MAVTTEFHRGAAPNYYLHLIDLGRKNGVLTDTDVTVLQEFIDTRKVKTGKERGRKITPIRKTKIAQTLITTKRFLKKEWSAATIKDLGWAVDAINSSKYKRNTRNDLIRGLKTFYKWLIDNGYTKTVSLTDLYHEDKGIQAPGVDSDTTEARDLLTRDEIAAIIGGCLTNRDKAIVATLYESAGRISEIARLTWDDLEYTNEGVINLTITDEKTHTRRHVPLLMAMEYLASWRASYPGDPTGKVPIFIDRDNLPMDYRNISYQITRAATRAGITKRANPHVFRKSRLTEMVREGYQESVIKEVGWNNQSSQMLKTYIKLGKDDVMNEFLDKQGIKKREQRQKKNVPQQCSFCFAMNSAVSEFCHKCGAPLSEDAKAQIQKKSQEIESALTPEDKKSALASMTKDEIMEILQKIAASK